MSSGEQGDREGTGLPGSALSLGSCHACREDRTALRHPLSLEQGFPCGSERSLIAP